MTRRSLTHQGGKTAIAGDSSLVRVLANALDVPIPTFGDANRAASGAVDTLGARVKDGGAEGGAIDDDRDERDERNDSSGRADESVDRKHVHGFHTYPARLHPLTAQRLIEALSERNQTVLDPFCGSGTVLVEGLALGRSAIGIDLNPLAVMLATMKTRRYSDDDFAMLMDASVRVAETADDRRERRAGATRRLPQEDVSLFAPHTLLELDGLRSAIEKEPPGPIRDALWLVLSAILVKFSQKRGDTSDRRAPKRFAAGFAARFYVRKTSELVSRLQELRTLVTNATAESHETSARVVADDARTLRTIKSGSADVIITSPPYVATYDYVAHHELRMRWLGLRTRKLEDGELGARRTYADLAPNVAESVWQGELRQVLQACLRVARRDASIVLVIADSAVRGVALRANEMVARAARDVGLTLVAEASQPRPHFHRETERAFLTTPRAEHALLLKRAR